jgi:type I protein arginine methyltransferase
MFALISQRPSPGCRTTQRKDENIIYQEQTKMLDEINPYQHLWTQRHMVRDYVRGQAYRKAILETVKPGDVVLDAGAGTGLLSLLAAQAGAKKVYAVERTNITDFACKLVDKNQFSHCIEVIQRDLNEVELPSQVDVILSEWMGGHGLDENLLAPILVARDRWLKPNGKMIPELVTTFIAPVWDSLIDSNLKFYRRYPYGVDLNLIADYMAQEMFVAGYHLKSDHLLATPKQMWQNDPVNDSIEQASSPLHASLSFTVERSGKFSALAAWFSSVLSPGITLTNAPDAPETHWGRNIFPLSRTRDVESGMTIEVKFTHEPIAPNCVNHRWWVRLGDEPWEEHSTSTLSPAIFMIE